MGTLTREELFKLVWTTPMSKLAVRFGVSDVALANTCAASDIPRPGRGYWQQLAFGQKPDKERLPKAKPGTRNDITIGRREHRAEPGERRVIPDVTVTKTLAGADPVVKALQERLGASKYGDHGMLAIRGEGHAVLKVGRETEKRALHILNAIFKALRDRGHGVRLRGGAAYGRESLVLEALVGGEDPVEFWLIEHVNQSDHVLTEEERKTKARGGYSWAPTHDFEASGRLIVETHSPGAVELRRRWADGKKQRLEDILGEVVIGLEAVSQAWRADRQRRARETEVREDEQRRREEAEHQATHRRALGDDLVRMATAWRTAETVRLFLAAVGEKVPEDERTEQFAAWFAWAKNYMEGMDPLKTPDTIAKHLDLS